MSEKDEIQALDDLDLDLIDGGKLNAGEAIGVALGVAVGIATAGAILYGTVDFEELGKKFKKNYQKNTKYIKKSIEKSKAKDQ